MTHSHENRAALTAKIVSAYVTNNSVQAGTVPALIASVYTAVAGLGGPPMPDALIPTVDPERSVFPDQIVCLEDGKRFKTLRLHLSTHGLTPRQYRSKWGLSSDYPMMAPNYAAKRSTLAYESWKSR